MKKLILALLVFPMIISAQNYNPIVKEGGIWREVIVQLVNPPDQFSQTKIQYSIIGDTVIETTAYKKIYSMDYSPSVNNTEYIGAIREDSAHRVYALLGTNNPFFPNGILNNSIETLIYDFNLIAGDTFLVSGNPDSIQVVNNIDSVLVSGHWRKRINFALHGPTTRIWIEGIGDQKGLFFPALFEFENWNTLTCYEDATLFWTNPELVQNNIDCFSVGIDSRTPAETFAIKSYPNPASSLLNFEFGELPSNAQLVIYDALGQKAKTIEIAKNQRNTSVSMNEFSTGIYFYKLTTNQQVIGAGKFIRE